MVSYLSIIMQSALDIGNLWKAVEYGVENMQI